MLFEFANVILLIESVPEITKRPLKVQSISRMLISIFSKGKIIKYIFEFRTTK